MQCIIGLDCLETDPHIGMEIRDVAIISAPGRLHREALYKFCLYCFALYCIASSMELKAKDISCFGWEVRRNRMV